MYCIVITGYNNQRGAGRQYASQLLRNGEPRAHTKDAACDRIGRPEARARDASAVRRRGRVRAAFGPHVCATGAPRAREPSGPTRSPAVRRRRHRRFRLLHRYRSESRAGRTEMVTLWQCRRPRVPRVPIDGERSPVGRAARSRRRALPPEACPARS